MTSSLQTAQQVFAVNLAVLDYANGKVYVFAYTKSTNISMLSYGIYQQNIPNL